MNYIESDEIMSTIRALENVIDALMCNDLTVQSINKARRDLLDIAGDMPYCDAMPKHEANRTTKPFRTPK